MSNKWPTDHFVKRFKTPAQAERYHDRFQHGRRKRQDRLERSALHQLLQELGPLTTTMDLPAGTGRFSETLAAISDRTVLADASHAMLQVAQKQKQPPNAHFVTADALHIPLRDRCVDLLFCHRFYHHVRNAHLRSRILTELVRVTHRYLLLPYYSVGPRRHLKWILRACAKRAQTADRPMTYRMFKSETAAAGLTPVRQWTLRNLPLKAVFVLFERR